MKFNFLKSNKKNNRSTKKTPIESEAHKIREEIDVLGFTTSELLEYDKSVKFFYTNIINSIILYTFNEKQLDKMTPILLDPITELYEELDYALTPVLLETVFRNKFIDRKHKEKLIDFKCKVDKIPNEIWDWKYLDKDEKWKILRKDAETLLNNIGVESRKFNDEFTTVILNTGKIIKKGTTIE